MSYNATEVTAKNTDHYAALKGLLRTAFADSVKIIDEGWPENTLEVKSIIPSYKPGKSAFTRKQKRTLRKLGYEVTDLIVHGG